MQILLDFLVGECEPPCYERRMAMRTGRFVWSDYRNGWVVPPWTEGAPAGALDVVYRDCPWCGLELPTAKFGDDDDC